MHVYSFIFTFHIIFAGMWLAFFIADTIFVKYLKSETTISKNIFLTYLNFTMVFEIIGVIGMLFTGVFMAEANPGYGFFVMTSNHWLATKQIIFVVILLIAFFGVLPKWKKLISIIKSSSEITSENSTLKALHKFIFIINILVVLNFLFAVTHTFYS